MKRFRIVGALGALACLLALAPLLWAATYNSNFLHEWDSGTVNIFVDANAPYLGTTIDAEDTPNCSASSQVITNVSTGSSWTVQMQASPDNSVWYNAGAAAVLGTATGQTAITAQIIGQRYVRVIGYWGTKPSTSATGTLNVSCKR